jgi:hypothetical protein
VNLLFNPSHMIFESDGTRYDLVLVNDPYGGVLVAWPATGYLYRWHTGDRLKSLTKNDNPFDRTNIFVYLESANE